jgi:hypothetical protein
MHILLTSDSRQVNGLRDCRPIQMDEWRGVCGMGRGCP